MDVKELLRHPVAFYPILIELTGSPAAALFLSQCIYWTPKTKNKDGWFYKRRDEWQKELNLSFNRQLRARKVLNLLKILEEKYNQKTQIMSFRIDTDRLFYLLQYEYRCIKKGHKIICFESPNKPSINF